MEKCYLKIEVDEEKKDKAIEELKKLGYAVVEDDEEEDEEEGKEEKEEDGEEIKRQFQAMTGVEDGD